MQRGKRFQPNATKAAEPHPAIWFGGLGAFAICSHQTDALIASG